MSINTTILASIYEIQGYKQEAMLIYEEILRKDPNNNEAKAALTRLKMQKYEFLGVNTDKLQLFVNAHTQKEYQKLEEWLLSWN